MMSYKVQGWADLGTGGRTKVFAEGNTFQAAKANLEHIYPNVINVGSAEDTTASTQHSGGAISERLFAIAFPGVPPGVVFGLAAALAGYFMVHALAMRITTDASITSLFGMLGGAACGIIGFMFARVLMVIFTALIAVAIAIGLFWLLSNNSG